MATEATRKLMAKKTKNRKLKGSTPLKATFDAFCKDVYEKAIDGMFTVEVSRKYKLSVAETRRWLELISLGKAAQYPGIYSEENGTVSCCSGEYLYYCEIGMYTGGYGHWWHYKNPGEES